MAGAAAAVVTSCLAALPAKFEGLSLNTTTTVSASACPSSIITATSSASLSFSSALSQSVFSKGSLSMRMIQRRPHIGTSIVCEAAPKKKIDSAVKRARQAEKRRTYNKSRKSEIRTRMKKVLEALAELKKKPDAQPEEVFPIEKLIAEAYSVIDKAVRAGILHRNTGARRKSRLARNKKVVEIHHGWYAPTPIAS
uniref:Small ribosomal subunit protein bS20c n=1 Tax=Rhizophora mucronata TaxID=61149 RepID=A0A2P2JFS2_RHIMU